jgi:WD40 repeat protein
MRRALTLLAVAAWLGVHAMLWTLLPPVPRLTIADPAPFSLGRNTPFSAFTPDGLGIVVNHDAAIKVWNVGTGQLETEIPLPQMNLNSLSHVVVMSPVGRRALVYDESRNAPLFVDLENGGTVELPPFGGRGSTESLGGFARLVAFAPDGEGIVCSDWSTADSQHFALYFRPATSPPIAWRLPDLAENLAIAPDGKTAAAIARGLVKGEHGLGEGVYLVDKCRGRVFATAETLGSAYGIPAFSSDSRTLATGQMRWPNGMILNGHWPRSSVQLWDVPSLKPLATFKDESLVGWLSDARLVTASEVGLSVGSEIRVRDGRTGALIAEHHIATFGGGSRAEWLPDTFRGRLMAACRYYDPPPWRKWLAQHIPLKALETSWTTILLQVIDVESGNVVATFPASSDVIALSPDGRTAAVVDNDGITIWDLPPRKPGGIVLALMIAEVSLLIARTAWRRSCVRRLRCAVR